MQDLFKSYQKEPKRTPPPPEGTPERAEYHRIASQKTRDRKKAALAEDAAEVDSPVEIDEERAKEILVTERLIRHPHVLDVLIDLAKVAARLKIPANEHLYRYGVQKTLAALESKEPATPVDPAMDRWEPGQRIRVHEQWAIWDYSLSWRTQKDGTKIDFERLPRIAPHLPNEHVRGRTQVHGKESSPRSRTSSGSDELFVHRNPDLLPEEYDHTELVEGNSGPVGKHHRMLLAARNSSKNDFDLYDFADGFAHSPTSRLLCAVPTNPHPAIGHSCSVEKYSSFNNPLQPTLFQQLWPEMCISAKTPARIIYAQCVNWISQTQR